MRPRASRHAGSILHPSSFILFLWPFTLHYKVHKGVGTCPLDEPPATCAVAPALAPGVRPGPVEPRYALLINPFYPQRPAHQLRQARADAEPGADEHRGGHAAGLARPLLGRKPAARAAALEAVSRGGRHHRPPDLCPAGLCPGPLVSAAGGQGHSGRAARHFLSGGGPCRMPTPWPSARACSFGRESSPTSRRASCSRSIAATIAGPIARTRRRGARLLAARQLLTTAGLIATPRLPQPLRLLLPVHRAACTCPT